MERLFKILMVAVLVLAGADAHAAIYYVKTNGLDTNTGLSAATPFKTLTKALQMASAGDTIYIGGGTYTDQPVTVRNGSAALPIRVIGDTKGVFTGTKGTVQFRKAGSLMIDVQHSWVVFETIRVSSSGTAFRIGPGGLNTTFNTCTITGCTTAIQMTGGSATFNTATITTISGTVFDLTATSAVSGNGTLTLVNSRVYLNFGVVANVKGFSELLLSRCSVYSNTNSKLVEVTASVNGRSQNLTMSNCLVYRNAGAIVQDNTNATVRIFNSTFDQNTASKLVDCRAGNATVLNSIFSNTATALAQTGGSITHTHNLFWKCTTEVEGTPKHSTEFTADPMFTSGSSWIPRTGSPAIDAGVTISGHTTDRAGASRPLGIAYDIGAYERAGPSANTPYSQTFESLTTPGTEWSLLGTTTSANNIFTVTSRSVATKTITPMDNARTLQVRVNTVADTAYTLFFDVVFMGSWDGSATSSGPDVFNVSVNGELMISGTFKCGPVGGNGSRLSDWTWPGFPEECRTGTGNFGGSYSTHGAIFRRVRVDFTPDETVSFINFWGSGLQGWNDEAWAIDNVIVATTASSTITTNAPRFAESGRAHGFFVQPRNAGTDPASKSALLWADIDRNGYPDAVAHNTVANSIVYFVNEGSMTSSAAIGATADQAMVADLDNDGVIDIITSSSTQRSTVRRGNPAPAFNSDPLTSSSFFWSTWPNPINTGTFTRRAMAVLDVNGDGWCDVLHSRPGTHEFYLGQPDPTGYFVDYARQSSTDSPFDGFFSETGHAFSTGDVNNDGYPDVFHHGGSGILMLSNGGSGPYTRRALSTGITFSDSASVGSAWGDVDNDGDLDLIIGDRVGAIVAMRNDGAGTSFTSIASTWGLTATGTATPALGDYDNDGDLDLFFTAASGLTSLYRNNRAAGTMTFTLVSTGCRTESSAGDAKWIDVNSDGLLDIAFTSNENNLWTRLYKNISADANPADTNLGRFFKVSVVGFGKGGINKAAIGTRVELWDSTDKVFLQRRDLGVASGLGGQESLTAHFGGVNPATTYTLRIINGPRTYTQAVTPKVCSTDFGANSFALWYTFTEPEPAGNLKVVRWREVSSTDNE
jgi:hypothetical protein